MTALIERYLWNTLLPQASPERAQLGVQISTLSTQLKSLKQDVKLCNAILERAIDVCIQTFNMPVFVIM